MKTIKFDFEAEGLNNQFGVPDERMEEMGIKSVQLTTLFLTSKINKTELVQELYNLGENKQEALFLVAHSMFVGTTALLNNKNY